MPEPEGYRKALRMMEQAEKFGRPIITFIDTPRRLSGQRSRRTRPGRSHCPQPDGHERPAGAVIAVVTGEGSSGGALALGVANRVLMLENAIYSVLSPEGFASILWKDASRRAEACEVMKLTAQDLYEFGVIEEVIPEPLGGAQSNREELFENVDASLKKALGELTRMSGHALVQDRYDKFRKIGQ